jgi:IclR family acetate operon transcriptional repressor
LSLSAVVRQHRGRVEKLRIIALAYRSRSSIVELFRFTARRVTVPPIGKLLLKSEKLLGGVREMSTVRTSPAVRHGPLNGASDRAGGPSAPASTRTVERAIGLLSEVCAEGDITLSECARQAQIPTSTALRLLRTLEASGLVSRDEAGAYRPGPRLIQLGAAALGRVALVRMAEPALRRIVAATGESTYLSMAGPGDTAIYVAMVEGTHSVRHTSWVGRSVPLADLALGVALRGLTPAEGYVAQRDRMEPDVTAIAATIQRPGGIAGAISLLGPSHRIDNETMHAYGRIIGREARALAEQLGVDSPVWTPTTPER